MRHKIILAIIFIVSVAAILCSCAMGAPKWTTYAEYMKIVDDYKRKDTDTLLEELKSSDPIDRQLAALGLGAKGKEAIEPLLALSKSSYYGDRFYSISALSDIYETTHDERALRVVIEGVEDNNTVVALGAIACLDINNPKVIDALIKALKDTRKDSGGNSIQDYAAKSLAKIGKPSAESLIKTLEDKDPQVRYRAVKALGDIKDERATVPLINLLGDKVTVSIRYPNENSNPITETEEEIRMINLQRSAFPTPMDYLRENKYAREPFPTAMAHRQRDAGAEGAGIMAKNVINWMLKERSYKISISEVSRLALVNIGPPVTEHIAPLLKSDDSYIRSGAVYVAGGVKAVSLTGAIADILKNDNDPEARKTAALSLAEIGDNRAVRYLNEAQATEKKKDVKDVIAYSIKKLENAVPTVMQGN